MVVLGVRVIWTLLAVIFILSICPVFLGAIIPGALQPIFI
jgi:hypothetical protein